MPVRMVTTCSIQVSVELGNLCMVQVLSGRRHAAKAWTIISQVSRLANDTLISRKTDSMIGNKSRQRTTPMLEDWRQSEVSYIISLNQNMSKQIYRNQNRHPPISVSVF